MITPKAYPGLRILLVLTTLFLAHPWRVNAQCPAKSNPQDSPATTTTENNEAKPKPDSTTQPKTTPEPTPGPTPFPLSILEVKVPKSESAKVAGLGDEIIVVVNCLKEELSRQQNPKSAVPEPERIDPHKFALFLDMVEMKKLN